MQPNHGLAVGNENKYFSKDVIGVGTGIKHTSIVVILKQIYTSTVVADVGSESKCTRTV